MEYLSNAAVIISRESINRKQNWTAMPIYALEKARNNMIQEALLPDLIHSRSEYRRIAWSVFHFIYIVSSTLH
jgi:hypothetical protein